MRTKCLLIAAMIVLMALVGCNKEATATPAAQKELGQYNSPNLGTGYENAINPMNQLILGTLKLESTADAVTPEQAKALLPLWQMVQGDKLQSIDESNAVLKQIETQMTGAQLAAIEAMQLTNEDMRAWMEEQGIAMPQGGGQEGQVPPGGLQNLSEEERAQMREEFQNMSAEERATRMAEMGGQQPGGQPGQQTGGQGANPDTMATRGAPGGGAPGGGGPGGGSFLIQPLITMLTERAAQ